MNDLLVVVPSRGRPQNIERLVEAMENTCRGDTSLLLGLDEDDPRQLEYELPLKDQYDFQVESGLRQVVAWVNAMAVPRVQDYRFIGTIGDDNVPRTEGWDVKIMKALEKTPFAFGDDLYPLRPTGSLCCHLFCRSEIIGTLGYLGPPALRHMFVDDAWMAWGRACGITFCQDVVIEHLHHTVGKAAADDTYLASGALMAQDSQAFEQYCRTQLSTDIEKIRGLL